MTGHPEVIAIRLVSFLLVDDSGIIEVPSDARAAASALIRRTEHTNMNPKNTICLWFDKDALQAARFYAATFPDSKVTAVHERPLTIRAARRAMC